MARVDDRLTEALAELGSKPSGATERESKQRFSQKLSEVLAQVLAEELRSRGMTEARPDHGAAGGSGAERRMSGGIGAKKVDVTWATEESGLLLAISVKTIMARDNKTGTYQKNLTNRRGDMLMEAVTLHRRFPYAVLAGMLFFDEGAAHDGTDRRRSTFDNANSRMRIFTGRDDPAGRDEQYERMYLALVDSSAPIPKVRFFHVGRRPEPIDLERIFDDLAHLVAERNPDFYEEAEGCVRRV